MTQDTYSVITTRRSTRRFRPDAVPEEKLRQVVEAGRYAPSGGNSQTTHFFVIRDKAVLAELARLAEEAFSKMEVAPDTYRSLANSIRAAKKGGYVFHYSAPVLILFANRKDYGNNMADCCCALENMAVMANALDLGTCYINQINWLREDPAMLSYLRTLGLTEDERVYASLAVGLPDTPDGLPVREALPRKGNPVTYIGG